MMINHQYLPWNGQSIEKYKIPVYSEEFRFMQNLFASKNMSLNYLFQHRDANKYMQFLIRQQFLCRLHPNTRYYTVKKFIAVNNSDVDRALRYNLDHRRCPIAETFNTDLNMLQNEKVIFVILVTTDEPFANFKPARDSDYYIEYIAYINS